jgi:hypothetical protein
MSLAHKIAALLTGLTRNQVEAMSPVERQQLVDQCRRITALADPSPPGATVKGGVLADLQVWRRDE